jgi:UDP-N-acetylmuramoyl-tripeptide--D-alanyl-D-alanine ligase
MGMRGFGQIRALKALAMPDTVVITNVGETHMELLGSMENIAKAKSEILENLTEKNDAILNGDDPYVQKMHTGAKTTTYGIINNSAVKASNVEVTGVGTTFTYTSRVTGKTQYVDMPLIGRHNVMNALAAIAVAEIYGVDDKAIADSLHHAVMTEKRQEILHFGPYTAINDAYNASPASMQTACNTLEKVVAAQGKGRAVAVLADMLELGTTSQAAHARVGGYVAAAGIKELITYGTEAKAISKAAEAQGVKVHHVANKEAAATLLKSIMQPDDVILFKGSHSMEVDKVIDLVFKGEGK